MQEMTLAHYWMGGVMVVMAIFGGLSVFGYDHRLKQDNPSSSDNDETE